MEDRKTLLILAAGMGSRYSMTAGYRLRTGRTAEIHIFEPSAGAHLL